MGNNILDSMIDSANVNGHIEFVEGLLSKYEWKQTEIIILSDTLQLIKDKQNDKNVYMAVVGEFSSGKSSFINAQISDDLLKTDVLQATTSAATIIKYGEKLDVSVQYKNGNIEIYSKRIGIGKKIWRSIFKLEHSKHKNEIREFINMVTADEQIAKDVDLVTIMHSSKVLQNGLVIIDTPGTNAINERHELVTAKVIKEIADAAIIVIPSNVPLSNSLLNFVRENLSDVISKCVFIVTKMDLIRMKEQQRVLDYIVQKLKTEFSTDKINVFPYTPLLILRKFISDVEFNLPEDHIAFLTEQSKQTESQIIEVLKQQRLIIQMQKLIILMKKLLDTLEQDLRIFEKSYKNRHAALEKNKIKDLGSFIKNQKKIHKKAIIGGSREICENISYQIEKTHEELLENLNDDIFRAQNHNELNSIMKKGISLTISRKQEELEKSLPMVFSEFQLLAQKQKSEFEREFKKLYTNLSTLGGQLAVNDRALSLKTSDMVSNYAMEQLASVKETVKSENNKVAYASAGGVGAGALIGTAILPGVGTVVGAVVGSLAGLFFRKPLNELKSQYYTSVKESIDDSFQKAKDSSQIVSDDIVNGIVNEMFGIVDIYFSKYDLLVKEMIKRDEQEKKELERKSEMINKDLHELNNRRSILDSLRNKL